MVNKQVRALKLVSKLMTSINRVISAVERDEKKKQSKKEK